jgi:C_GCAxxG_C_C family probable redox protein
MSELIMIRAYGNRFEAEQAQQILHELGIDAMVQADDAGGMYAGLSLGKKGVRLVVRERDAERAREALEPGVVVDPMDAAIAGAGPDAVPAPLAAAEAAARHFDAGHNCAEAVLRAFAEDRGEFDVVRLATGFGGGMGRDGDQCGALSGAVMVVGLWFGRQDAGDDLAKERCYELVHEVRHRFREACGHLDCRDLTGADLRSDAGRAAFEERATATTVCRQCVREAASIVADVLAREI